MHICIRVMLVMLLYVASGLHLAAVESENWSTSESYLTKYKRQQAERQPTPVQPGANLVSQYQIGNEDASSATEGASAIIIVDYQGVLSHYTMSCKLG